MEPDLTSEQAILYALIDGNINAHLHNLANGLNGKRRMLLGTKTILSYNSRDIYLFKLMCFLPELLVPAYELPLRKNLLYSSFIIRY